MSAITFNNIANVNENNLIQKNSTALNRATAKLLTSGSIKKIMHLTRKAIFSLDLYKGKTHLASFVSGLKIGGDMIDVYASANDLCEWYEYFAGTTVKQINKEELQTSLKNTLKNHPYNKDHLNDAVANIVEDFFAKKSTNEKESRKNLAEILKKSIQLGGKEALDSEIEAITEEVKINFEKVKQEQKSYTPTLFLAKACCSVADLGDVTLTLQKYGVFKYALLAANGIGQTSVFKEGVAIVSSYAIPFGMEIITKAPVLRKAASLSLYAVNVGAQLPVFKYVVVVLTKIGIETSLTIIGTVGLAAFLAVDTYKLAKAFGQYCSTDVNEEDKAEAKKKMWKASIGMTNAGVNIICNVVPLFVAFNPFVGVVVIHVISKGTSLGCGVATAIIK